MVMVRLGHILLASGFIWVTSVAVGVGPLARAMRIQHREKKAQRSYTREEVEAAYGNAAYEVAHFAQWSLVGCLLICAGGVALIRSSKRDSAVG